MLVQQNCISIIITEKHNIKNSNSIALMSKEDQNIKQMTTSIPIPISATQQYFSPSLTPSPSTEPLITIPNIIPNINPNINTNSSITPSLTPNTNTSSNINSFETHIIAQLNWLINKKQACTNDLLEIQQKMSNQVSKIIQNNITLKKQYEELWNKMERNQREFRENQQIRVNHISSIQQKVHDIERQNRKLQQLLNNSKLYNIQIEQKLLLSQKSNAQLLLKISQLQQLLALTLKQKQQTLSQQTQSHNSNIQKMIQKYQTLISQKVTSIQQHYQSQLSQIQQNNRNILQQLQQSSKTNIQNTKQQIKKNNIDSQRLINQNGRLLFTLNQNKRKIVNLQHQVQNLKQEVKIISKEKEIVGVNYKRQIQVLKESKVQLEVKVKGLYQAQDGSKWDVRQMQIQKQKQIKKIKQQSQAMIDQIVASHKDQLAQLKSKIKSLTQEHTVLQKRCEQLKRQRDSSKQIIQFLKKQKQSAQSQKQSQQSKKLEHDISQQQQQNRLKLLNSQLKKQILRKNAQIQVLKQQISRLKSKVNKITIAYQQNIKSQQLVQKQNKMLLSEIVFLRDKNRNSSKIIVNGTGTNNKIVKNDINNINNSRSHSRILDIKSQASDLQQDNNNNNNGELEMYKQLIVEMEKDMNQAVAKLDQKNIIIQKQKAIIQRLERALNK